MLDGTDLTSKEMVSNDNPYGGYLTSKKQFIKIKNIYPCLLLLLKGDTDVGKPNANSKLWLKINEIRYLRLGWELIYTFYFWLITMTMDRVKNSFHQMLDGSWKSPQW